MAWLYWDLLLKRMHACVGNTLKKKTKENVIPLTQKFPDEVTR